MESHEAEEFLGQSMEGARRLVLFSLYHQLSPIVLEEDSALVKTLLFRESVERYKHEKASLYNPARSLKHQLKRLNEAGYAAAESCSAEKFKVHAGDISTLSGKVASLPSCDAYNIPYILVIPFSIVPMKTQLAAIHAQNFLKQEDFTTFLNMPTPLRPYLISDVSAGEMYKGRSVSEALPLLKAENRLPLSLEETIALLTQTRGEILHYHNLIAAATLHQKMYIPDLYRAGLDNTAGFSIKLKRELPTNAHPHWGIPSCSARITL